MSGCVLYQSIPTLIHNIQTTVSFIDLISFGTPSVLSRRPAVDVVGSPGRDVVTSRLGSPFNAPETESAGER